MIVNINASISKFRIQNTDQYIYLTGVKKDLNNYSNYNTTATIMQGNYGHGPLKDDQRVESSICVVTIVDPRGSGFYFPFTCLRWYRSLFCD